MSGTWDRFVYGEDQLLHLKESAVKLTVHTIKRAYSIKTCMFYFPFFRVLQEVILKCFLICPWINFLCIDLENELNFWVLASTLYQHLCFHLYQLFEFS